MPPEVETGGPGVLRERPATGVVRLTLNRPQQRNALTGELAGELRQAVLEEKEVDSARVLIVTGAGSSFCAGADLGALTSGADSDAARRRVLTEYYRAFLAIRDLGIPTIAAVNGPAVGAGLNLALSCDLRVLGRSARLAAPFLRLGIHPGGGCTWMLTRISGPAAARELLMLGEPVGAERAFQLGLASQVVDDEELGERALDIASRIAGLPRPTVMDLKRTLRMAEAGASFEDTLAFEGAAQAESMGTEDAVEGWAAFRERRQPIFRDR